VQKVASPTIRNSATLGGNLTQDTRCKFVDKSELWRKSVGFCMKKDGDVCRVAPGSSKCLATFCSDLAPALIVLDAEVVLQNGDQQRIVELKNFYQDNGQDYLLKAPSEILVEVRIPENTALKSCYEKLRLRGGLDFPEAGVAFSLEKRGDMHVFKTAFASMSSHVLHFEKNIPCNADKIEIEKWIEEIYCELKPKDTMYSPPLYRKKAARNILKKIIKIFCN
jgi:4-hydroxybenzoyl-CoA reductase subunit beta